MLQVKTAGSSYGKMESESNRSERALLGKSQGKAVMSLLTLSGWGICWSAFLFCLWQHMFHMTELHLCIIPAVPVTFPENPIHSPLDLFICL